MPAYDEWMDGTFVLETAGQAVAAPDHLEFAIMQSWRIYSRHWFACKKYIEA